MYCHAYVLVTTFVPLASYSFHSYDFTKAQNSNGIQYKLQLEGAILICSHDLSFLFMFSCVLFQAIAKIAAYLYITYQIFVFNLLQKFLQIFFSAFMFWFRSMLFQKRKRSLYSLSVTYYSEHIQGSRGNLVHNSLYNKFKCIFGIYMLGCYLKNESSKIFHIIDSVSTTIVKHSCIYNLYLCAIL